MIKVVFVSHTAHLGGAETVLLRFLAEVKHFEPIVFLPPGQLAEELVAKGVRIVHAQTLGKLNKQGNIFWPLLLVWRLMGANLELLRCLRQHQPQVVQANTLYAIIYSILPAKILGIPLIWHVHDFVGHHLLHSLMSRWFSRWVGHTITASESQRQDLISAGVPAHRITTMYSSIFPLRDEKDDAGVADRIAELRQGHERVFGVIGTLEERKGTMEILQALELANGMAGAPVAGKAGKSLGGTVGGKIGLVIAGGALDPLQLEYKANLVQFISDHQLHKEVLFLGHIRQIKTFLSGIDALIHFPKYPDPLPTVILEAMISDCPVIVSDNGGNPEMVQNGRWGRVVPAQDSAALATAMREPPPEVFSLDEKRAFSDFFSPERKEREHERLYKTLLDGKDEDADRDHS